MIFCGLFSKLTKGLVFLRIWQHDLETVEPHHLHIQNCVSNLRVLDWHVH